MNYITLEEANLLFEKHKLETYPYSHSEYNYSIYDCLKRNHITRRLPLYIKTNKGEYEETRNNIRKYKDFTKILFVDKNHLKRFFEKELSPKFSCSDFYGFGKDEDDERYEQSEVSKLLRPGMESIIGKIIDYEDYEDYWDELFLEWRDDPEMLSVEMKYIGSK